MTVTQYVADNPPLRKGARETSQNNSPRKAPPHWRVVIACLGEPFAWRLYPDIGAAVATVGAPGNRLWLIQGAPRGLAAYRAALILPRRTPLSLGFIRSLPIAEAQQAAVNWVIAAAGAGWVSAAQERDALKRQRIAEQWAVSPASASQRRYLAKRAPAGIILNPGATAGEVALMIEAAIVRRQTPRVRQALFGGAP
jgi:hypothetical protein